MSGDESLGRLPTGCWLPTGWRAGAAADQGTCCRTLALQRLQVPARVEPELLGQDVPDPAVHGQRVGLAAVAVQRGDQRVPETLAQRMQLDEGFELPGHVASGPQLDPGRKVVLEQSEADLFQAGPMRLQPGTVTGVDKHVAAEERERLPDKSAASARSPPCRRSLAVVARVTTRSASTRPGSTSRAYPPGTLVITPGTPSARRSWDTFDCSVFRPVVAATSAHRSSMSRSARTGAPASIASRTSTSVVFPDGSGTTAPSRRTSTGPSTAILSILAV